MKYVKILSIAASIFSCAQSVADTVEPIDLPTQEVQSVSEVSVVEDNTPPTQPVPSKTLRWVGSASIGPVWEDAGQTQTFFLAPNIIKTYDATKTAQTLADAEVFLGFQKELSNTFFGQLGLAVAATSNAAPSGNIWDDADAAFNNYSYSYQIQHTHIAVKGKLLADKGYWFMPWLSMSLGVGFNSAYDYLNTPLLAEAVSMPNFRSNTTTTFTYTFGAGIQQTLNPHWQVGIGYEFADWGQTQLNRAAGQTLHTGLSLSDLYTNGILFNLTYLA